ncbi:VTT domain-containing protein [Weissella sagaensis]|uniref:VTT domain-containing protein n=1 Tax=Weissella sagaensis TaxID=2559928 RepID=A0ABW1RU04_9LACO|nr:VTT domain-containing protein [Weissella sagaensis]KAA8433238.1 cytochrome O ubiquinol oxidase [Weissella paramesenteroides]MBU7567162.1 VTT domain-containing protein [Weissella hellenica]KAA8439332.1 cytochrome O ubiquinol oxidase [Weissella paramesenteroides]QDJ59219.1 cytochrome O ubiquinol oxidase [Weissella hellenica]QEA56513.1 cytochrome O ubiquinol oxidase [Weissella hellenica]
MIQIIDIFLHLDVHLNNLVNTWGGWSYAALFAVIFIETGAVVLPFLPGDSLLFAAGSIAALSGNSLNHWLLMLLFWIAALSGDSLNFFLGRTVGLKLVRHPILGRFIKEKHLQEANDFFVKHGKMAIILGRFLPIIRTLVPFTAAVSGFRYRNFIILETIAVTVWVIIAVEAGFYFGGNAFVSEHFSLVLIGILLVSALPAIISAIRQILLNKKQQQMNK